MENGNKPVNRSESELCGLPWPEDKPDPTMKPPDLSIQIREKHAERLKLANEMDEKRKKYARLYTNKEKEEINIPCLSCHARYLMSALPFRG